MSLHDLATAALRNFDPEDAHRLAIAGLKAGLGPRGGADDPLLRTTLAGIDLPNPVGLAPGFDKNAEVFGPMLRAGFGFVECGTVTPRPQAGNPRPRLFRLTEDRAADYVACLRRLWGMASYFTVNVSSPNTPGLRALQTKAALEDLLGRLAEARDALPAESAVPMFLKVAPDLEAGEVEAIVETVVAAGMAGIIVSNTTIGREGLSSRFAVEAGGLSGAPLRALSTRMLAEFAAASAGRLTLVGAGGIASGADAYAKIRAGASAVQLYSALVFEGPGLVNRINRELSACLRADGFNSVQDAVGAS